MNEVSEFPTVRYFATANPVGPGQDDVPALLRRVADTIEELGPVWIQDVTFENEINEHGDWYSLTVYFHEESNGGE
ncbi:hypothetical protein ABT214_19845 [Micromonospora purpureochromogenes]|uniref:hypothetical protein n=1 Tax=Micromonospora TaxID=1873 RepID=UPI001B376054|nr:MULTISPECIES: hypothetical protein [Micromonospora]MBQ0891730.1 hypothetical protein [Micromonospora sp. U56]